MKLFTRIIKKCNECPCIGYDNNITRYLCDHKKINGEFLHWMTNGDDNIKIPKWCPLPDSDFINSDDFKL